MYGQVIHTRPQVIHRKWYYRCTGHACDHCKVTTNGRTRAASDGRHTLIMADSKVVAPSASTLDSVALRDINSIEDAQKALANAGIAVRVVSDELGDGFSLLDDKAALVASPFLILSSTISAGDFGTNMVTMRLVTKDGRKYVINDGSTGIRAQAEEYAATHDGASLAGLLVERGLRASAFKYCADCQHVSKKDAAVCSTCGNSDAKSFTPGSTFYLDTSAAS